jgi:hypothetical protein
MFLFVLLFIFDIQDVSKRIRYSFYFSKETDLGKNSNFSKKIVFVLRLVAIEQI